ncbi:hypothetical protein CC80DRAFT_596972 [Byssothecium circinans]|uniref:NAD(P)-binding protein n=1 Tax=Byssothecium circinans TaxID=147558 RepID=A0A6A5TK47_9PLEO|nr:hypothetical protein CC80DRAFT_596972 [Byssothecium circinans]
MYLCYNTISRDAALSEEPIGTQLSGSVNQSASATAMHRVFHKVRSPASKYEAEPAYKVYELTGHLPAQFQDGIPNPNPIMVTPFPWTGLTFTYPYLSSSSSSSSRALAATSEPRLPNPLDFATIEVDQIPAPMSVNGVGKFANIKTLLPLHLSTTHGVKVIINVTSAMSHFASNTLSGTISPELLAYAVHPGIVATLPPPAGLPEGGRPWAVDDVGLCGAFSVWLVKERREWLSGRYVSGNWDV